MCSFILISKQIQKIYKLKLDIYFNQKLKYKSIHIIKKIESLMAQTKVSPIFQASRVGKSSNLSHLEQEVGNAFVDVVKKFEGQDKRTLSFIKLNKVVQVPNGKDKASILVYFSFKSQKVLLTNVYKKLVNQLQKKLKRTVLIVSARNIQSRWVKANKTLTRPNSRTLTAVYASILDELLLPGVIINQRTRVGLDGASFTRITIDKSQQHFLEDRVNAIRNAYKKLTSRDIEIDFQKQPTFYVLKKGERR